MKGRVMKKAIILVFIFLLVVFSFSPVSFAQVNNEYKWVHLQPQGNSLQWVKRWDANNWYAIGYGATFMKTSNAGLTWYVINNICISPEGIPVDLYDAYFFDMNTGWACGSSGKVINTTDGGNTWDTTGFVISADAEWFGMRWINSSTGFLAGNSEHRLPR